jgi:NADH:ubiquinone oxidoreductase subunit 2 (subunit N)
MTFNSADLLTILPTMLVVAWACVLLMVIVFTSKPHPALVPGFTAAGLLLAGVLEVFSFGQQATAFGGMLSVDGFS